MEIEEWSVKKGTSIRPFSSSQLKNYQINRNSVWKYYNAM